MKVWITKYALTQGILEAEAKENISNDDLIAVRPNNDCYIQYFSGKGKEWHLTKESAIARAEEMRIAKLKSLDKQHKKISGLVFESIIKY